MSDHDMTEEEREGANYLLTLMEMEAAGERTTLAIGPYSAFSIIALMQLATRHPDLPPPIRRAAREIARQLHPLFAGTPGEEMIKKGEHPEWDV